MVERHLISKGPESALGSEPVALYSCGLHLILLFQY